MKTKNLAVVLVAGFLAALTAFMLFMARDMVPQLARIYVLISSAILALAAICLFLWLCKTLHAIVMDMVDRHQEHAAKAYELEERRTRLALESQERLAAIHLQLSRVAPGTVLIRPELNILPSQQDILALPAASSGRRNILSEQAAILTELDELPTNIRYEEIKDQIPAGHILVGIGRAGIETKIKAVGACLWIVGLSGTGKTSTTVLRVEERAADNHVFLGVDPHWFKDDSLYHAIYETLDGHPGPYANRFAMPMATTPADSLKVLKAFLNEFNARKAGQRPKPWQRITLLVDEVGAQMDKATATTPEEKEIIELLPSIARICGQESRNFEMGGIFISQQATGLAWLRKVALMVIVHQLLQESEKKLATNEDAAVMKAMKTWPIGRTYVYGVGFGTEGPRVVQQPYFKPEGCEDGDPDTDAFIVDADDEEDEDEEAEEVNTRDTDELPIDEGLREALEAWNDGAQGPRAMQRALGCTYYQAGELCKELKRRRLVEI